MSYPSLMDDVTHAKMCLHREGMHDNIIRPCNMYNMENPNEKS
jgi:hypothetical protein